MFWLVFEFLYWTDDNIQNKVSLIFCLYIRNGLNLFLLTANYMCWQKEKIVFFFSPVLLLWLEGFCYLCA